MKLWDKGGKANDKIDLFTVGNDRDFDVKLARFDLLGSLAHAKMLRTINILNDSELKQISKVLNELIEESEKDVFIIEDHR